jgi:hypothetical protein
VWDVFANQSEHFASFVTPLLSLLPPNDYMILVGKTEKKSYIIAKWPFDQIQFPLNFGLTYLAFRSKLTFKVQLSNLPSLVIIILIFFSRWESPPNISGPSSSAWLRWWRTSCCSSVLSLLSCWHSLQVYPTSSIWLQVLKLQSIPFWLP